MWNILQNLGFPFNYFFVTTLNSMVSNINWKTILHVFMLTVTANVGVTGYNSRQKNMHWRNIIGVSFEGIFYKSYILQVLFSSMKKCNSLNVYCSVNTIQRCFLCYILRKSQWLSNLPSRISPCKELYQRQLHSQLHLCESSK